MRLRFGERDPLRVGAVTLVVLAVLAYGIFQIAALPAITGSEYRAMFAEAGGIEVGDPVVVAGVQVGEVGSIGLGPDVDAVEVGFTAKDVTLGDDTTAKIETETLLGTRRMVLDPAGAGQMASGDAIPKQRTISSYRVAPRLEETTRRVERLDVSRIEEALNVTSDTLGQTPDDVGPALRGIRRVGETVSSRDAALSELLDRAERVTSVLRDRTGNLTSLVSQGNLLLEELIARREVIRSLLVNTRSLTEQISALADEQQGRLAPALAELNSVVALLRKNEGNIVAAVQRLSGFITGLGEGVSSGPTFMGHAPVEGTPVVPAHEFLPNLLLPGAAGAAGGGLPNGSDTPARPNLPGLGGSDR